MISRYFLYCLLPLTAFALVAASPDSAAQSFESTGVAVDTVLSFSELTDQTPAYQDGIFTGESPEWTGMRVQVHIAEGKIKKVKVLHVKGTPEYYDVVVKKLPRNMEKTGTVEVDSITGATLSSDSLKKAVQDALKKAVKT